MTAYRQPEEVRAALEGALQREVRALEGEHAALAGRNEADVEALVQKRFPWRRVAPYVAGFLLALAGTLPIAFDVTRMVLVRSMFRQAPQDTAFIVHGDMDTVSRSALRALRELAPGGDWELSGNEAAVGLGEKWTWYRRLNAVRGAGRARETTPILSLHDVGSTAIRVDLHGCGRYYVRGMSSTTGSTYGMDPWNTGWRVPLPWHRCLPGRERLD